MPLGSQREFRVVGNRRVRQAPTNIYVFASPRIPVGAAGRFDANSFERLAVRALFDRSGTAGQAFTAAFPTQPCTVWFPSTVFIDNGEKKFAEYRAAKACAEATAGVLNAAYGKMRCLSARLPRLPSDQTQSLIDLDVADPVTTLVHELLILKDMQGTN